jgi:hypothetical protein
MIAVVQRVEDRIFAFAAEFEYRLKLAPRGTRLVPTVLHRWVLRFLTGGFIVLIGVFAFTSGATRTRAILGVALGALLAALGLLMLDARRGMSGASASSVRRQSPVAPPRKRP